jgi:hypothetical protein
VSILMDPVLVDAVIKKVSNQVICDDVSERQRIMSENIEECIQPGHRPLVAKLKE